MKSTTIDTDNFNGQYAPGDIVGVLSGGPAMTVVDVCPDCGEVEVSWFNYDDEGGFTYFNESFPSICLELAA